MWSLKARKARCENRRYTAMARQRPANPLDHLVRSMKAEKVEAVQDPALMKRDHISSVGRMLFKSSRLQDPEPFLTTNELFASQRSLAPSHPAAASQSWATFDIITGLPNERRLAHSGMPEDVLEGMSVPNLPRAQGTNQHFVNHFRTFRARSGNERAMRSWKSADRLHASWRRQERAPFAPFDVYERPVTASHALDWPLAERLKEGRRPKREFNFGCAPPVQLDCARWTSQSIVDAQDSRLAHHQVSAEH